MRTSIIDKKIIKKILILAFWLLVWSLGALVVSNNIVLVGPWKVIKAFADNIFSEGYLQTVLASSAKIGAGLLSGLAAGIVLSAMAFKIKLIKEVLSPFVSVLRSIPVVSFVVLLLIWFGSGKLSFFISMLIVFPNIYVNALSSFESADKHIEKAAEVFSLSGWKKALYVYRPSLSGSFMGSVKVAVGLSWKSGVAAEVIGLSDGSVGEKIYMSKIGLDTAGLFAWTLTIILLSFIFEKITVFIVKKLIFMDIVPSKGNNDKKALADAVDMDDINVSFGSKKVLDNESIHVPSKGRLVIMGESGIGKTTLLNDVLEKYKGKVSAVFQEDALLEDYSALTNIMISASGITSKECTEICRELLDEDDLKKKVSTLSGGMKRRVSILRALMCDRSIYIMDEPFTGLDEELKKKTIRFVDEMLKEKTLIIASHIRTDAESLNAGVKEIKKN